MLAVAGKISHCAPSPYARPIRPAQPEDARPLPRFRIGDRSHSPTTYLTLPVVRSASIESKEVPHASRASSEEILDLADIAGCRVAGRLGDGRRSGGIGD